MRILFVCFLMNACLSATAQLYIGSGAQLQLSGNAQLTLRDANLLNNGTISTGNGTILFSGAANSSIGGTVPVQFYIIRINKDPGRSVILEQPAGIRQELQFTQGFVDLNGNNLNLGSTGSISGESETGRTIGVAGGEVWRSAVLNSPSGVNPGNLGAMITSTQNLGNVVIKRGHLPQSVTGGSILRYYDITPANNTGLGATLRFHYLDAELNGLPENRLAQWRSEDGVTWSYHGFGTREAALNYVEKGGIDSFSVWTLSNSSDALPVIFTGFNLECNAGRIFLRWKTAQEDNSSHFVVERNNGAGFTAIGQLPAAGFSSVERSYEFVDDNPGPRSQYRIAQYDIDGRAKHTHIIIADCSVGDAIQAWPNPFVHSFIIKINSSRAGTAKLRVLDARGATIINRSLGLQRGNNQFDVDLRQAAAGMYLLTVEWAEGQHIKTMRLIKQ